MLNNCQIEKPVVLVRKYRNAQGKLVSFPQCKIVEAAGEFVAFRDIWGNKSQLFRDRAWNLDHVVFDWLQKYGVKKLYYREQKAGKLYRISLQSLANALKRKEAYQEKLNNHTQIFIPKFLFAINPPETDEVIRASRRWITDEIDVSWGANTFGRLEAKQYGDSYVSPQAKTALAEIWKGVAYG